MAAGVVCKDTADDGGERRRFSKLIQMSGWEYYGSFDSGDTDFGSTRTHIGL